MRVLHVCFLLTLAFTSSAFVPEAAADASAPISPERAVKLAIELTTRNEYSDEFFLHGWPMRNFLWEVEKIQETGGRLASDSWSMPDYTTHIDVRVLQYSYCAASSGNELEHPYLKVKSNGGIRFDVRPVHRSPLFCFYRLVYSLGQPHDLLNFQQDLVLELNAAGTEIEQLNLSKKDLSNAVGDLQHALFVGLAELERGSVGGMVEGLSREENAAFWNRAMHMLKQVSGLEDSDQLRSYEEAFPLNSRRH